jgi:altronate dehydratase
MVHPAVGQGLFLEHGCEKTHNDYMRHELARLGRDPAAYGWASIQMDGGMDAVLRKVEDWFEKGAESLPLPAARAAGLESLRLGLMATGPVSPSAAAAMATIARTVARAGGTVIVPRSATLLDSGAFIAGTLADRPPEPSLSFGQIPPERGFYIMETPTSHWVEVLSGLGATGVDVILAVSGDRPMQAHPFIRVVQLAAGEARGGAAGSDFDLVLAGDEQTSGAAALQRVLDAASRRYEPHAAQQGNVDFQITRGLLGVST